MYFFRLRTGNYGIIISRRMLTSILQRLMENVKKRGKKGEYWKNVVILHRSFSIKRLAEWMRG